MSHSYKISYKIEIDRIIKNVATVLRNPLHKEDNFFIKILFRILVDSDGVNHFRLMSGVRPA